ncbi:alcohol dehydrogenase-like protein [Trichocladium antarcticum]|uniref:Alcohol dehydrogenase-like protein n=1 Tax=Trichocladium antarcticum TaxID=1450529 RepID=A0AAN6ZFN1_9PEZI|nr:alcohol dehydrogenase-like protein [Trichocladium antarcticum]
MSLPTTQKQWLIQGNDKGFDDVVYQDGPVPQVGDNEVLVKLRGASINFRDLIIPQNKYPFPLALPVVAGSDGAGEIVAVGARVTKWKAGDRVVTLFNQGHQAGPMTAAASATGLGGCLDGTLRQYGAFSQDGVVRMPANLDFVEGASLVCAALTSWNALYGLRPLKKGQTVLVQGTGGVSLFALQFAKAAGATVIATTSSAEKAEIVKKLGADHVINYREDENWGETARKLSPRGEGVDHVIEVGGEKTMAQSLRAVKIEGVISLIGMLGGMKPKDNIMEVLARLCTIRGVYVGSREQLEDMVKEIEKHNIHPVIDKKVFTLETAKEAYEYMLAQKHFGKIGIKIE